MLRCYIEGKNLVNGVVTRYDIADGAVFTENYNETLDSGTILIKQLSEKIDIEPYDVVVIETGNNFVNIKSRRMCVDTYTCTQISLQPAIYQYEISLFSETKQLEGILCPSLKITKLVNSPRKVYWYLDEYITAYGPKLYSNSLQGAFGNKWMFGHNIKDENDTIVSRFNNIDCPELQWNEPTLREVLNDLMMVDDCIPVLQSNVINFIDISDIGNEITDTQKEGINYITESQSSADYVSELKMNLVNVASNDLPTGPYSVISDADIPNTATHITEYIGFRNNNSYLLTSENMRLQTSFPIWKIFYCAIHYDINCRIEYRRPGVQNTEYVETQIYVRFNLKDSSTNYILEYNDWLTRDVKYNDWLATSELSTDYRNTCLYYVRGERDILNFNTYVEGQFLFIQSNINILQMITNASEDKIEAAAEIWFNSHYPNYEYIGITSHGDLNAKNAVFQLSYEPLSNCVFRASKTPFQSHIRQVIDNQTNSYIDVERQGLLEYMKANRLGNKMALINGRYYVDEDEIPDLSQKINDKIIFRKEICVYNNYINVNYQATENYVLRNYFTGVKAKLRSWRVISGNEALTRAESIKFYINENISSISNSYRVIPSYNNLDDYLNNFKYCAIQFHIKGGGDLPAEVKYENYTRYPNCIMVEFTKYRVGNSVIFTIQFPDNRYCGNYVSNYNGENGRIEQKGIGYADVDGEFIGMEICFYNEYIENAFTNSDVQNRALRPLARMDYDNSSLSNVNFPFNALICRIPVRLYKDNGEIPQISIQFEMNEDANDMFLGKK